MEIFLQNKYSKWYFSIIEFARNRKSISEYVEIHHIIPKSMGGNNSFENLVSLSAKEHFICHLLLVKAVVTEHRKKMNYAFWRMCNGSEKRYKPSSRLYALGKQGFINSQIGHAAYLTSHTEESKNKISKTMSRILSILTPEEMSARMLNSCSHPDSYTPGRIENMRLGMIGKKKTKTPKLLLAEQNRKKMSKEQKLLCGAQNKGKTWKIIDGKRTWIPKEAQNYT